MKKIIFSILFTSYFIITGYVYAAGAVLSLSPTSGTFNKGCKFSLQVKVDTAGYQTDGTDAILIFDPAKFNADQINNGSIYPDYPANNIDNVSGRILISGISSTGSAYSGSGVLATVDFTVKEAAAEGATQIKFDFDSSDKAKTTDSNVVERATVADVLSQVIDGSYVVGAGSCTAQSRIGVGAPATPSANYYIPSPTPYIHSVPQTADLRTTISLAITGSVLILIGIIGIAFRR